MSEISHLPARPFRLSPGALLRGWMARRAFRRSQRHLLALDRHLLRDIGVSRHGIHFHFGADVRAIESAGGLHRVRCSTSTTYRHAPHAARRRATPQAPVLVTAISSHEDGDTLPMSRFPEPAPDEPFDAVVLCTGSAGSPLLKSAGIHLPLMPVHGYSVSFGLKPDGLAPLSAVVDAGRGVAIARLGERVRVSGGFELGELSAGSSDAALAPLYDALNHWFPYAIQRAQPQIWKGARPMLPEGPPVIGPARTPGLWLNLGHGAHGWTLACGSARLLADQIAGREPLIDPEPYSLLHWQR